MQLGHHFRELVDSFSGLILQHVTLARVELKEDARAIGAQIGRIAAFAPMLLVGYFFLNVSGALFLGRHVGFELAFLFVALANLAAGGLGIFFAVKALQGRQVMDDTEKELQATAIALRSEHQ